MVDIDKELEELLDDPLLNLSEKEAELFDIPTDMRKAMAAKNKADYVAQRKLCADFEQYRLLFKHVHQDLKQGKRSLVKISKTINLQAGHYYVVDGQMLFLEAIGEKRQSSNSLPDGRTRCIYENGTESDILLQTLRKNVVGSGYAVTELQEESESKFFTNQDLTDKDKVTGYIYVLRSLSKNPAVSSQKTGAPGIACSTVSCDSHRKDRESALVQVVDTTFTNGIVEYHLGEVLKIYWSSK